MIAELTLPRLGETMETGRIAAWLKQPGEAFKRGETLVEIESDKTVVEMPALADGVLAEIIVAAGEDADVGAVLCRYEDGNAEATRPAARKAEAASGPAATTPSLPATAEAETPADAAAKSGGIRATPVARRIARQHGIPLPDIGGSGRRGRIEAADIQVTVRAAAVRSVKAGAAGDALNRRDWPASLPRGPRLVLLHGLAADLQSWAALAPTLARSGRSVTAVDLPGHGGSTAQEACDLDQIADAVVAFLATLGPDPVELVGHSLGATVATRVARRAAGRVARLTLLAPAGLDRAIDVDFIRSIVAVRSGGALQHLLRRLVVRPAPLTSAQFDVLAAELAQGRLAVLAEALVDGTGQQIDITADLRALSIPVRIVWGLQDRIIPWTQVSQAPSHCAIHLIQDAGHVPHWDQPAEVAALLD